MTADLPRPSGEAGIESALPFLLLGPLSDVGYLDAVAATFEAACLDDHLPALAAGLAYKVLSPPERGWRRLPVTTATAGVFAGLRHAVPDANLAALARHAELFAPALNHTLAMALARGHAQGEPLLLCGTATGEWILWDADGLFPLAWAGGIAALAPVLSLFPADVLLVEAGSAAPSVLRQLDEAGRAFVTDAPPGRGECWGSFQAGPARLWTNGRQPPPAAVLRQSARLREMAELAGTAWEALTARPAVPLAADRTLEYALTLAAGVALASLSWGLWREREATDPLLALERLGNLGASVGEREGAVRVAVPLGRRGADLARHRFLDDVTGVPWLLGRTLTFARG